MVWLALEAARSLAKEGLSCDVINMHTIKPIDEEAILNSIRKTKCVVTAEEHQMNGGLGESVAQVAQRNFPVPQEFVAVKDTFGESGTPTELLEKYGLSTEAIIASAKAVMSRK
jgi:transketolase